MRDVTTWAAKKESEAAEAKHQREVLLAKIAQQEGKLDQLAALETDKGTQYRVFAEAIQALQDKIAATATASKVTLGEVTNPNVWVHLALRGTSAAELHAMLKERYQPVVDKHRHEGDFLITKPEQPRKSTTTTTTKSK